MSAPPQDNCASAVQPALATLRASDRFRPKPSHWVKCGRRLSHRGIDSLAFLKNSLSITILGLMRATIAFNSYPAGPGIIKSGDRKWTAAIFLRD